LELLEKIVMLEIMCFNRILGSWEFEYALLHIVPFCEGPNKKLKVLRKKNKKHEGFCEGKKICQICDAFRIATCGEPLIAN
jgi:hypothetical protein